MDYRPVVPTSPADPKTWQMLSTLAVVVAIVGFVLGAGFAWLALALSGVFFAVELLLKRRSAARS